MTDGAAPRRRTRELVLKALYAAECGEEEPSRSLEELLAESDLSEKNSRFARDFVSLVQTHREWADNEIARLAHNWKINRLAAIDRTIMRMALVELEHIGDTPFKVAINEAIELARTFSTSKSPHFVNGILDGFVKGKAGDSVSSAETSVDGDQG